mgnify:CR=1 FL=1
MTQILTKLGEVKVWLATLLGVALMLAIAAVVAGKAFGLDLPFVRELGPSELAYLAGAYWLAR